MTEKPKKKMRIRLEQDCDYSLEDQYGDDGDGGVRVAYLSRSREVLGTEAVDHDRMDEISQKIKSGEYVGLPVYAYVHGGVSLSTGNGYPYNDQWDAGQSGFVYIPKSETGYKRLTKKRRAEVEKWCRGTVNEVSAVLEGDVWGVVAEKLDCVGSSGTEYWTHEDSCWGYIGRESAEEEAKSWAEGYRKDGWEVEAMDG